MAPAVRSAATLDRHRAVRREPYPPLRLRAIPDAHRLVPPDCEQVIVDCGDRRVTLTHLRKPFWPALGITKGDLLRYYVEVAAVLLPHLHDRPMVMRRYPEGAGGPSFFMKRMPAPRPPWVATCAIEHVSGRVIELPMVQDLPSLLWIVNLGCIDLNQWYAPADDVDRPDCLHFDLDPGPASSFVQVLESALAVREALAGLGIPSHAKTSGARGLHVYVPLARGPLQLEVWRCARVLARALAARHPDLMTIEYGRARRPPDRVLVDYNQNAWGRTLASVYSVRPTPWAGVSTPVTWREVSRGIRPDAFRLDTVPARVRRRGDLWAPLLARRGRVRLERFA